MTQVEIGSVRTTAHRTQIRLVNNLDSPRPNITLPTPRPTSRTHDMARANASPDNVGMEQPQDSEEEHPNRRAKRRREDQLQPSPALRRSKRIRHTKLDSNFVYYDRQ
ncbi:uncharacterized protein LOC109404232 [Aedes albopictus]|uniref:Secreted protein n=1 Tax=Aedes albopictus TaxID=7160 RepID=A0ABM1Y0Z1_AEDAL|nr:uncharacterized protein LOC109423142 [Aedes albopictus]XP_029730591.1 uncharacterized protein LOC109404232 [Aedes albopictus]